jgi:hypothetical protein
MHSKQTVSGILKDFLKAEDSELCEINLFSWLDRNKES